MTQRITIGSTKIPKPTTAEAVWTRVQIILQEKLHRDTYDMWFRPTKAHAFIDDALTLSVENEFCELWLQDNYLTLLRDCAAVVTERNIDVRFVVAATKRKDREVARPNPLELQVDQLNLELIQHLKKHPDYLYKISPRKFEEVVGDILHDLGCDVEITPQTRDGGRDILAAFPSPAGKLLAIVECKRFSPHRKVGIDLVERFLWVMDKKDRASCGLLVTTTYFSPEAKALETEFEYRLKLRDFSHLKQWIANYGKWTEKKHAGLWLPKSIENLKH